MIIEAERRSAGFPPIAFFEAVGKYSKPGMKITQGIGVNEKERWRFIKIECPDDMLADAQAIIDAYLSV
jgi:hypothetical protein